MAKLAIDLIESLHKCVQYDKKKITINRLYI